jgi:large conductance mechanosensitive channel
MAEFMGKMEKIARKRISPDTIVRRGVVQEFRDFINRGNVVDISVAFVMGAAFKTVVDSFAGSAEQPGVLGGLIGAIFGGTQPDFSKKYVTVNGSHIELGRFATAGLNFLLVAVALFVVVKFYNRLRDKDVSSSTDETPTTNELLAEIRDELRRSRD